MYNLSIAFSPPNKNPPHSVIINYHFYNETIDETHTWFWANSAIYYLYSIIVFQFLSGFFGKPEPLFERKAIVTMDATQCLGVNNENMELLAQGYNLKL